MALSILLVFSLVVAVFVGFNIGGSSTGVAFGPAVGSRIVGKIAAAALMTGFALLGGWTVGRNVVSTMGGQIVPADHFTLAASAILLFFTGLSLLISNLFGVPASTSMTAVGAIVGLGLAVGDLNQALMFDIVGAWLLAPVIAFWIGGVIGRYLYPTLDERFSFARVEGALVRLDRSERVPRPALGEDVAPRDFVGAALVLAIACYMAFSAGASNTANAVAPLVGSGAISIEQGVVLAVAAIGVGAFTIARRTLDTVGEGLTDLPVLAALIVSVVSGTIITVLSQLGIPASLAVSSTMCIVGLGWGRASRTTSLSGAASAALQGEEGTGVSEGGPGVSEGGPGVSVDALATGAQGDKEPGVTVGSLAAGEDAPIRHADAGGETTDNAGGETTADNATRRERATSAPESNRESSEDDPASEELRAGDLFDPAATARVVVLWMLTPTLSAVGSYVLFELLPFVAS